MRSLWLAGWIGVSLSGCVQRPAPPPPSIAAFDDAVHHWQNLHGRDYARYRPDQVDAIAANILLLQRDNGGWIENRDPLRILDDRDRAALRAERDDPRASFDNRNIYAQVAWLVEAHDRRRDPAWMAAAMRGLDFILDRQLPRCGGWPHTLPASQSYHDKLTIADEVTSGNLRLLRHVASGKGAYTRIDPARRSRAAAAVERGDACILRLQVRRNGVLTGWAGQYDPVTLAPVTGRSFELPSIVSQETVEMLRYLMEIDAPSPEVVASVDAGVAWLERVALRGVRLEEVPLATPVRYSYHTATFDRRLVADPAAPPLWARFYDLRDDTVVLANRDGVRVARYAEIHPERRSGYSWYGDWPAALIGRYPAWKARHTPAG